MSKGNTTKHYTVTITIPVSDTVFGDGKKKSDSTVGMRGRQWVCLNESLASAGFRHFLLGLQDHPDDAGLRKVANGQRAFNYLFSEIERAYQRAAIADKADTQAKQSSATQSRKS